MDNYCQSCGISIPEGQDSCSMCYGDPSYGTDGYYEQWMLEQEKDERLRQRQEEE